MGKWLKADTATDLAFAYKLIGTGAGIDEYFLHLTLGVTSDIANGVSVGVPSSTRDVYEVFDLYGEGGDTYPATFPDALEDGGEIDGIRAIYSGSSSIWQSESGAGPNMGGPITPGVHEVDVHVKFSTDTLVYTIDGVVYDKTGLGNFAGYMSQADALAVGGLFGFVHGFIYYATDVKLGTTGPGSSDLLDDDFATGDFSLWDGTYGDVSIVDTPAIFSPAPVWTVEHVNHENVDDGSVLQEVRPESLHFVLQLGQQGPGQIDYAISVGAADVDGDPAVSDDSVQPYITDFNLKRSDLTDPVMSGMITTVSGQDGDPPLEQVQIAGQDWLHYLDLRVWPYDATLSDPVPSGLHAWPDGFVWDFTAEVGQQIKDILETVRDLSQNYPGTPDDMGTNYRGPWLIGASYLVGDSVNDNGQIWIAIHNNTGDEPPSANWSAIFPSFSLPFLVDADDTGFTTNINLAPFDSTTILALIQGLSQAGLDHGGFDFYMTFDKIFKLVYPEIGDPDSPVFTLEVDATTHFADMVSAGYTNTGPTGTHVLGTGAGTANRQGGINKHFPASSAVFRRIDQVSDFGNVKDLNLLESLTSLALAFASNPAHQIPIEVNPADIPGFWTVAKPGAYVTVDYDFGFHHVNSTQKIVAMDCAVDTEGVETVTLTFNQFYDASDQSGINDF